MPANDQEQTFGVISEIADRIVILSFPSPIAHSMTVVSRAAF